jgi:hypothetical protein
MTPEEKAEMDALCRQIAEEQDRNKFLALVQRLNNLLDRKDSRLQGLRGDPTPAPEPQD